MVIRLGLEGSQPGTLPPLWLILPPSPPQALGVTPQTPSLKASPTGGPCTGRSHSRRLCPPHGGFSPTDLGQRPPRAPCSAERRQRGAGCSSPTRGRNSRESSLCIPPPWPLQIPRDSQRSAGAARGPSAPIPQAAWEILAAELGSGSTKVLPPQTQTQPARKRRCRRLLLEVRQ